MNSVQTVTSNSALNQNWVGCTVRTPKTQVARTLRAPCPGRGRCCAHNKLVARMSRAQPAQVARLLSVRWSRHAQVACPRSRPQNSRSRHPISTGQVATSNRCRDQPLLLPQERPCRDPKPWSRHQTTTRQPEPCRDINSVSRHHSGQSKSRPQNGVATSFLLPNPKPGRDTKTRSLPSWRLTYVATSISCRDLVSAHSGISRSRCQKFRSRPPTLLPMSRPQKGCRDLQSNWLKSQVV